MYDQLINEISRRYGLDPGVVYATIQTESSGNPNAYRFEPHLGEASYGLGQLLESTARGLGYKGPAQGLYNPQTNVDLLAKYVKKAYDAGAKTPQDIATYYNTGHLGGNPTPGHIQRFTNYYDEFQRRNAPTSPVYGPFLPAAAVNPISQGIRSYVVQRGDTLASIAQKLLGNSSLYRKLTGYSSGNPNLIYPGETIRSG